MRRAAKRGKSLEERLSAVRASSEESRRTPMDPPVVEPAELAAATETDPTTFSATEGDTFLPAGAADASDRAF